MATADIKDMLRENPEIFEKERKNIILLESKSMPKKDNKNTNIQKSKEEIQETEQDEEINKLFDKSNYKVIHGNLYKVKNSDEKQLLGNFYIKPIEEVIKDNGVDVQRYFRLMPVVEHKKLLAADIEATKFNSMSFIAPTWGLKLKYSTTTNVLPSIRESVQTLAGNIEEQYIYQHTGWRNICGKWCYLHANGAIGLDGVSVELYGRLSKYSFPNKVNDNKKSLETMMLLISVAPLETIYPLIAITFLSPLNEFMRQVSIEPSFLVFLLGRTGCMKSTLAALFMCFFGEFDNKCLPMSFRDTPNSIEKSAFLLKDTLTVIDDFHPTTNRAEYIKLQTTAQSISRAYGDRVGRGRMNSDGSLKQAYVPRGNAIITGEDVPNIGESGVARNIIIEIKKDDIKKDVLTLLQNKAHLLNECMFEFIKWIATQTKDLPDRLKRDFLLYRDKAINNKGHSRIPESIAHLQVGFTQVTQFLKYHGLLDDETEKNYNEQAFEIFMNIANSQNEIVKEDKPIERFINPLMELIAANKLYVISTNASSLNPGSEGFVGYEDEEYYYLSPIIVYSEVKKFYRNQGLEFPVSKQILFKHLEQEGYIEVENIKGRTNRTKVKSIGSSKERYLWLKKYKLQNI